MPESCAPLAVERVCAIVGDQVTALDALHSSLGSGSMPLFEGFGRLSAWPADPGTECVVPTVPIRFVATSPPFSPSSGSSYSFAVHRSSASRSSPRCPRRPVPPRDVLVFRFLPFLFVSLASDAGRRGS